MIRRWCGYQVQIKMRAFRVNRRLGGAAFQIPAKVSAALDPGVSNPTLPDASSMVQQKPVSPFALEKAAEVKAILLADLRHHFTIKQLARKVGTNPKTLQDGFKELYELTIFAYGQELRLEHGKKLLSDPALGIQEIAEACGYPEHTNFTKAFKKKYGVVPGRWRKEGKVKSYRVYSLKVGIFALTMV